MEEVSPLVGDPLVDAGDTGFRLGPPVASRLATGQDSLGLAELPLPLAEELRSRDTFAIRQYGEVFESKVDPDNIHRVRLGRGHVGHLEFGRQADVPLAVGGSAEGRTLGGLRDGLRLADANLSDLGDTDLAVGDLDPLGDTEPGGVPLLRFESGESRPALEEVAEGPVQV